MSTPGYISIAKTKENGAGFQPIPAAKWTLVDLGLVTCLPGLNEFNAQLYFEAVVGVKLAVRIQRGSGDPTGQHDYTVKGPTWAISYPDKDYVKDEGDPVDLLRGVEVWSDKACILQTRILKITRPLLIAGETS